MGDATALRVLVVDDDADLRALVTNLLQTGHPDTTVFVDEAATLMQAAQRLAAGPAPDVVLLDLGLPDVPGITPVAGVAVLASLPAAPPIIAITGATIDRARDAVVAGATDFLDKSELFRPDRLWRAVVHAVERRRRIDLVASQRNELMRTTTQLHHLASRLKHDLRTPLAVAVSALDTLQSARLDEHLRPQLMDMVGTRLRELSSRLDELAGELAAHDSGPGVQRERLDVEAVLQSALERLPVRDRDRVTVGTDGDDPVWASPRLLTGLFEGLVRNAVQHNPDGNVEVRVEVRVAKGIAELLVADDGMGIAPAIRDVIFDVGWTTADPPALGVGLAGASSAVAMMEGTIEAVDSPLGGAAFRIELPQRGLSGRPGAVRSRRPGRATPVT